MLSLKLHMMFVALKGALRPCSFGYHSQGADRETRVHKWESEQTNLLNNFSQKPKFKPESSDSKSNVLCTITTFYFYSDGLFKIQFLSDI